MTLIINQNDKLDNDELLDYMLKNQIDLVISINQKLNNFDRFKKLELVGLNEKILSTGNEFLRKQIKLRLDVILSNCFYIRLFKIGLTKYKNLSWVQC